MEVSSPLHVPTILPRGGPQHPLSIWSGRF